MFYRFSGEYSRSDGVMEMASGWFNMGRIMRLGLISILLICVTAGLASAAVSLSGPATVTRGGVSEAGGAVDGYFNLSVSGEVPMHLGLIVNPQTMTGNICDRPPYLNGTRQNIVLGNDALVWPTNIANPYLFSQVSPNGVDEPSVGCWDVPWDGTHYYGLVSSTNASVQVGTLYPDVPGSNEFLATSVKPGKYQFHLQKDNTPRVPGEDSADYNVTVTYGEVTIGAYDFNEWSQGNMVPVETIPAGHTVMLQGINTDSQTTYLWVGGDSLPECGELIGNLSVANGNAFVNGTWYLQWTAPCTGDYYTIYASSVDPEDVVSRLCYDNGGCSLQCSRGGICGLGECPICGVFSSVTIKVTHPEFSFNISEIIDRCCCEAYPCGSADSTTSMNLTGYTGVPGVPMQIWLFGDDWIGDKAYLVGTYTSGLDEKGSFTLDLREMLSDAGINLCDINTGQYHLIIQIPGCSATTFDVGTEYIPFEFIGYDAFLMLKTKLDESGPSLCLNCPPVHDQYIHLDFSIRDVCGDGSVDFTGIPRVGYPPLAVQFTDVSTYTGGSSYFWDFGDNFTSVEHNPVHEYTSPGYYDVLFRITNGTTTLSEQILKRAYIEVKKPYPKYGLPVSNFTYVPKTAEPMTIQFIDQSWGATNLTYLWNFGDGSTSTEKVPAHTYGTPAVYTVSLTVTDFYEKSSTATKAVEVPAKPSGLPAISFTADVTEGPYPLTVQFLDTTITTWADSWQWNFGDGATSSLRSPIHTYSTPGLYTVTLRASNVNGEGTELTIPGYITVQHSAPVITATADPMSGTFPLRVEFTASATVDNKTADQSEALIQSWLWDFGDGSISSQQNPVHIYERPGSYPVTVTCTLYDAMSGTADVGTIEVGPIPYANFYWEYLDKDETCCYLVKFTDTSYGAISWLWDFGDGLTSDEQNPTHRFKEVGFYNVTLTVGDGTGATSVMTQTVQITSGYTTPTPTPVPPVPGEIEAKFYTSLIGTRTIKFTDQSTGNPTSWTWEFGDKFFSSEQNPTHVYPKDGEYLVKLLASNGMFSDSVTETVGAR
jgi:PKD repeat protein